MATTQTQRRSGRNKGDSRVIRLQIKDRMGNARWITADLLDSSDHGIGVTLRSPLLAGSQLVLRGSLGPHHTSIVTPATVKWCTEKINGNFHAGLEIGEDPDKSASASQTAPPEVPADPGNNDHDWYEIMQLSPNADSDTIARVYRILAQRYHPDSPNGNQELFLRLCEAHRVLMDPKLRAAYDSRHRGKRRLRWNIFDRATLDKGPGEERRKRRGILEALYAAALHDSNKADVDLFEFEELLGCPREHLDTALWYLTGKGFVKRSERGRFAITIPGFDEVERLYQPRPHHDQKQLEAGSGS